MDLLNVFLTIEQLWHDSKSFIEHMIGFSHDALHVLIGPPLQFLFAAVLRVSLRDFRPVALLLILELMNEWHDLRVEEWPDVGMQWGESAKDIILTMALPILIMVCVRFFPRLFERRGGSGRSES